MPEPLDLTRIEEVLSKYQGQEGAMIPILQEAQEVYGYLSEELLAAIGKRLRIPLSRIYGVVTFYAQFYTTPRGRYTVRVCRGTACHVRGGKNVLKAVQRHLGIGEGETTADFKFTFETVACLGACALSPVLLVNKNYYGKLTPAKVDQVLKQY
jgi:NADH-quinone oxidoreductase subunit E